MLAEKLKIRRIEKKDNPDLTKLIQETLKSMHRAQALYRQFGFKELKRPLGNTGHFSCDAWFLKDL